MLDRRCNDGMVYIDASSYARLSTLTVQSALLRCCLTSRHHFVAAWLATPTGSICGSQATLLVEFSDEACRIVVPRQCTHLTTRIGGLLWPLSLAPQDLENLFTILDRLRADEANLPSE